MSSERRVTCSRKRSICSSSVFGDQHRNSQRLKDYETIQFVIPNLKQRRNEKVISYTMVAHGYLWWVEADISLSTIKTRLILRESYRSCEGVKWTIEYSTRSSTKRTNFIRKTFDKDNHNTEDHIYLNRDDSIQKCLEEDGSLVIEYDIRMIEAPLYGDKPIWYPKELQPQSFLKELYDNASSKTSDVSFLVEGRTFRVHKSILSVRCKKLFEIAQEHSDPNVPIPLDDSAVIFQSILEFVYTIKTPEPKDTDIAMETLVAADRYECVPLKLYVESFIIERFLNYENTATLLLFADSLSCALLKEAVLDTVSSHGSEGLVLSKDWCKIKESPKLLAELIEYQPRWKDSVAAPSRLDVGTLRQQLQEANLELDGSREVLVARLEAYELKRSDGEEDDDV